MAQTRGISSDAVRPRLRSWASDSICSWRRASNSALEVASAIMARPRVTAVSPAVTQVRITAQTTDAGRAVDDATPTGMGGPTGYVGADDGGGQAVITGGGAGTGCCAWGSNGGGVVPKGYVDGG